MGYSYKNYTYSSMSTGLNSMTGVIFEDLIRPMIKKPISEKCASLIMKVIVVVIGTVCVGMVFVVENMGTIVQVHFLALKCI